MFTGLVEDIGTIALLERRSDSVIMTIAPTLIDVRELALGESVAIDGVCLTVTNVAVDPNHGGVFTVLAGAETLLKTTMGKHRERDRVNLERALRLGDRLGGHLVTGHIDGTGEILVNRENDRGANIEITIRVPAKLARYIIEKGSVAVDGISLTVNAVAADHFTVALIPHTVEHTTLAHKPIHSLVNIEVDMMGKYVERLLGGHQAS